MNKHDIALSALIGFFVAVFFLMVANTIGEFRSVFLLALPVFPVLAAVGMKVAFILAPKIPMLLQLSRFLLVGALNTFMDLGILNLLIWSTAITAGVWFSAFKGFSFAIAVINSYFWNKFWTFRAQKKEGAGGEFLQFLVVSVFGFLVNVGVASFAVNAVGPMFGIAPPLWANIGALLATVAAMTWNFLGYKLVVFRK
ncbi:GtrA family protein [Patescibacteria group bacterium]|nr:GtrA family protein [Patescibacteria group bacterium]